MPITEDYVKDAMAIWLRKQGYQNIQVRLGTRQGIDVEGVDPSSGKRLLIECKGEGGADQWKKSWADVAGGILYVLNKIETPGNLDNFALAFPDTQNYRQRMVNLKSFCERERIIVYWVSSDGQIQRW